MAKFNETEPDILYTHVIGDSGYMLLRPDKLGKYHHIYVSTVKFDNNDKI